MGLQSLQRMLCVAVLVFKLFLKVRADYGFPNPGEQYPSSTTIMEDVFFSSWDAISAESFDYVVIGTGFCGYAFVARVLEKNPRARILMLERGPFFLPTHYQSLSLAFQGTVSAKLETYPWSLTHEMAKSTFAKWLHGVAPFFGGRSTKWSGWCPRPTQEEMAGWPSQIVKSAQRYYDKAEEMLNVTSANRLFGGMLQTGVMDLLSNNISKVASATRFLPAPLSIEENSKFSVVSSLLQLVLHQEKFAAEGTGSKLHIVINCVVQNILEQQKVIKTSKGSFHYGNAPIVLAMGAIPPATLLLNSFPHLNKSIGNRLTSHFISTITAKVPREDFNFVAQTELGAFYLAGMINGRQYHIQATIISSPSGDISSLQHLMPDVLTTASEEQMQQSTDSIVFVLAILGEQDVDKSSWIQIDNKHSDITTNIRLQLLMSEKDIKMWSTVDAEAFTLLEQVLSPSGRIAYWSSKSKTWVDHRPSEEECHRPGLVHEGSCLFIGEEDESAVDINYKLKGSEDIYVTGGGLWPRSGSWNPTLTMVSLTLDLADQLEKRN